MLNKTSNNIPSQRQSQDSSQSQKQSKISDSVMVECDFCEVEISSKNLSRHKKKHCVFFIEFKMRKREIKYILVGHNQDISALKRIQEDLKHQNLLLKDNLKILEEENYNIKKNNLELHEHLDRQFEFKFAYSEENVITMINKMTVAPSTMKTYLQVWRTYVGWCKQRKFFIDPLEPHEDSCKRHPLLPSNANEYINCSFQIAGQEYTSTAAKQRSILQLIMRKITDKAVLLTRPKREKLYKRKKVFLTELEMDEFLNFLKDNNSIYYHQVLIQSKTGARINAVANLKLEHLLFLTGQQDNIFLPDSKTNFLKQGKYIDEKTRDILKQYCTAHKEVIEKRKFLFYCGKESPKEKTTNLKKDEVLWEKKEHYRKAQYLSRKINEEIEKWTKMKNMPKARTHDIRRSVTQNSRNEKIQKMVTKLVSEEIGHSNVNTTTNFYLQKNQVNFDQIVSETFKQIQLRNSRSNIEEPVSEAESQSESESQPEPAPAEKKILNKKTKRSSAGKIKPISKLHIAEVTKDQQKKFKTSFNKALKKQNIKFSDDLVFKVPEEFQSVKPKDRNNNIQTMPANMAKDFEKFKDLSRKQIYAPLELVEDEVQGWIVKATADIKKNTFVTEYSGTVIDFSDDLDSDSIMEFYSTQASNLVIYPDEFGNLGKYLSGVNNQKVSRVCKKKKSEKGAVRNIKEKINLPNCTSQKFNINGGLHVLIYTIKNIKEGEVLFYDYNAGHLDEIVTQDFV